MFNDPYRQLGNGPATDNKGLWKVLAGRIFSAHLGPVLN
jgi:hypothetical protein